MTLLALLKGGFSDLAQWSAFIGFLLPLLVQIVKQPWMRRWMRTVIGLVAAVLSALITAAVQNKLSWDSWATSVIFVAVTMWTSYLAVWVPLGAMNFIERKTTIGKGTPGNEVR